MRTELVLALALLGLAGPAAFGTALTELGSAEQIAEHLAGFADDGGHDRFGAVAWSEIDRDAKQTVNDAWREKMGLA